mgnify:CR=1 FL=1
MIIEYIKKGKDRHGNEIPKGRKANVTFEKAKKLIDDKIVKEVVGQGRSVFLKVQEEIKNINNE